MKNIVLGQGSVSMVTRGFQTYKFFKHFKFIQQHLYIFDLHTTAHN